MLKRKGKVREGADFTIAKNIASVVLIIYAITMMIPFLRLILVAFTEPNEYLNSTDAFHIPSKLHWKNFLDAWTVLETGDANMFTMLINSAWWSFGGAFLEIGTAAMLGYAVAKYKFFGRKAIHAIAVFTMMLPIYGAMAGNYVMFTSLGIYNSPWILITCCAGFGGTFIMVNVSEEAERAGIGAADLILNGTASAERLSTKPGNGVRYVIPQNVRKTDGDVSLFLRVTQPFGKVKFTVTSGEQVLTVAKRLKAAPGEMEKLTINAEMLKKATEPIVVALEEL